VFGADVALEVCSQGGSLLGRAELSSNEPDSQQGINGRGAAAGGRYHPGERVSDQHVAASSPCAGTRRDRSAESLE